MSDLGYFEILAIKRMHVGSLANNNLFFDHNAVNEREIYK
jgi:hypothetical protein